MLSNARQSRGGAFAGQRFQRSLPDGRDYTTFAVAGPSNRVVSLPMASSGIILVLWAEKASNSGAEGGPADSASVPLVLEVGVERSPLATSRRRDFTGSRLSSPGIRARDVFPCDERLPLRDVPRPTRAA